MNRKYVRIKCNGQICYLKFLFIAHRPVDLPETTGRLIDISRGGIGIPCDLKMPIHLPTLLSIRFTLDGITFFQSGRLVWRRVIDGKLRYGIAFWGSSRESVRRLNHYLDNALLNQH